MITILYVLCYRIDIYKHKRICEKGEILREYFI